MKAPRSEYIQAVWSVYDVLRIMLSITKSPATPRTLLGMSERDDGITGFLPVNLHWFGTEMDNSTCEASVLKAEMVTSHRLS